ncbi:hypothetical protein F5Y09DRAFT_350727 [Xylaria sp. FL1042]|nr:hypothetical protein F5Y09DRAFT_350727 [Xylaria sp. FL1042]
MDFSSSLFITGDSAKEETFLQDSYCDQNIAFPLSQGTQHQQNIFHPSIPNSQSRIPRPPIPARSQIFGDARDYLTPEQYQSRMPIQYNSIGRSPLHNSSLSAREPSNSGLLLNLRTQKTNQLTWPLTEKMPLNVPSGLPTRGMVTGTFKDPASRPYLHPSITVPNETGFSNCTLPLANPFIGTYDDNETKVPTRGLPSSPTATIMEDGYDVFNPSLLSRVENECRTGRYRNTPQAIATYHQLGMADDLYYSGIWKKKFIMNWASIFEFHNPALSCPNTPDHKRRDRRALFHIVKEEGGRTSWYKIFGGKLMVPAYKMKLPPAEYVDVLDLLSYFFSRAQCVPDIERYAELVAPLYIDRSPRADDDNKNRVGMFKEADKNTTALRCATMEEAMSPEALTLPDLIPTILASSPAGGNTPDVPAVEFAAVDTGMAGVPSTSTTGFPPVGLKMTPIGLNSDLSAYINMSPKSGVVLGSTDTSVNIPSQVDTGTNSIADYSWHFNLDGSLNYERDASVAPMSAASLPSAGNDIMDLDAADPPFDPFGPFPESNSHRGVAVSSFEFSDPFSTIIPPGNEEDTIFQDFVDFDAGDATASDSMNQFNLYSDNSSYTENSTNDNHSPGNAAIFHSNMFATDNFSVGNDYFTNDFQLPCINEEEETADDDEAGDSLMALD